MGLALGIAWRWLILGLVRLGEAIRPYLELFFRSNKEAASVDFVNAWSGVKSPCRLT